MRPARSRTSGSLHLQRRGLIYVKKKLCYTQSKFHTHTHTQKMSKIAKVVGFAVVGLLGGLAFGGINVMNDELETKAEKQNNALKILEDYDPQLLQIVLALSVMQDKHPVEFLSMHRSLVRLLTLEMYFPEIIAKRERTDWPQTASKYHGDIDDQCDALEEYLDDYEDSENMQKHLETIKTLAKDLSHNVYIESRRHFLSND